MQGNFPISLIGENNNLTYPVNFLGSKDGLVHISELQEERTNKTTDVCKEGDEVKVMVIGFDDRGKVKLSMKRVDQKTGEGLQ